MSFLVILFGLSMAALGIAGIVNPERLVRFARRWDNPAGNYLAAAIRLCVGLVVFLAAPESRFPGLLRFLGVAILFAGLLTALMGHERAHRILEWWVAQSTAFKRIWAGCAVAIGLLLIYAV